MEYIAIISIFVNGVLLGYIFSGKDINVKDGVQDKVSRVTQKVKSKIDKTDGGVVGSFDYIEDEPPEDTWTKRLLSKAKGGDDG